MALSSIVRSSIRDVGQWNTNIMNENMIEADRLYSYIRASLIQFNNGEELVNNGYLNIQDLEVVKNDLHLFSKDFAIQYDVDTDIFGSLNDRVNERTDGCKLIDGIRKLFENHKAGILFAYGKSFALIKSGEHYYFIDSHSCGAKGSTASDGKACAIKCDDIIEFHRICKRSTGSKNQDYIIHYIEVCPNTGNGVNNNETDVSADLNNNDDNFQTEEYVQVYHIGIEKSQYVLITMNIAGI